MFYSKLLYLLKYIYIYIYTEIYRSTSETDIALGTRLAPLLSTYMLGWCDIYKFSLKKFPLKK